MVALFSLTGVLSVAVVDDVDAIKITSSSSATQANIGSDGCGDRGGTSLLFVIVAVAFVAGEAASVVIDARECAPVIGVVKEVPIMRLNCRCCLSSLSLSVLP